MHYLGSNFFKCQILGYYMQHTIHDIIVILHILHILHALPGVSFFLESESAILHILHILHSITTHHMPFSAIDRATTPLGAEVI